jgi:NitT/TauT family transport system substrate-binding protein
LRIARRGLLAGLGLLALPAGRGAAAATATPVRLGVLQFGTVQWVADTIRAEGLDTAQQIALQTTVLANNDAGRIGLMAGSVDVAVLDWPFAALQRSKGTDLKFAAFSDTLGAVMAPAGSPIQGLADLPGKRLGVAGGPTDKSWLLVRAAARKQGIDLTKADIAFGAPPLLTGRLQQGSLDAVLTYWTFAARLQAAGARQVVSVEDCARALGLPGAPGLVGFAFHESWAQANPAAVPGLLRAVSAAEHVLRGSDAEWDRIRPLMNAPDPAVFEALRRRFLGGLNHRPVAEQEKIAADVLAILIATGGPDAVGGLQTIPPGLFWPDVDGTG